MNNRVTITHIYGFNEDGKLMLVATSSERAERLAELKASEKDQRNTESAAKKNLDFVQQSRSGMKHLRKLITINPLAALIFSFLSEYMNHQNAVVCSSRVLEEYFEVSRTSVYRAVKFLENQGYFMIGKSGQTNVYTLNPDIVWCSYGNNKRFCEFNGKILLAQSENKEFELKAKKFKEIMLSDQIN